MTKTAKDLVTDTLVRLKVVDRNTTPEASIYQTALDEYEVFHEWLKKEFGTAVRWNSDAVPDQYWIYVSSWFSSQLADALPISEQGRANAERSSGRGEARLREMLARKRLKETEGQYF